jgi:Pro-kumamolisin, activation domain
MIARSTLRRLRLAVGLLGVGVTAAFVLPTTGAAAAQHNAPASSQTPLPVRNGSAHSLGAYNASQTIRLTISLKVPHPAAEQQFLNAIQDKHSPLFHHFLSTAQWTDRFGPTQAAQNSVVAWAKSAGLTVTHLYPNRMLVDLAGPVSTIEKAFGVQINNYRLGGKTFFANAHDPVVPKSISGAVQSVEGLSNLQTMFPASPTAHEPASPAYSPGPVVRAGAHAAANGSRAKLRQALKAAHVSKSAHGTKPDITGGAYDPTDIYSSQAYDYNALYALGHCCNPLGNPNQSPPQTTIAIATFGSQQISDFQGFQAQYPYLAYSIQEEYIDGTPTCCDAEGTMDAEWSTAMSNSFGSYQDTSKVYLYDGANFNDSTFTDIYNQMVSDNVARVFSTSWSCTEPPYGCNSTEINARENIFNEMVGQGWTLTAASGDRGAYDNCANLSVSFPADSPDVVGAGGTTLSLSSGPVYNSETGWAGGPDGCSSNDGGSGGGCSSYFAAPSFQSNEPCGSGSRAMPDISLNADWYHTPQNLYFDGSLGGNGGTSIVAPELAGFFAQEDSYLLSEGNICGSGSSACAPMGNANYPLYETGINGAPHNPYYDITSGCNSNNVGTGYCAGTGWDAVTGWGSANMLQLAWAFNWHLLADDGRPGVTFSGPTPGVWYNTDQTVGINVADSGGGFPASGVAGFSDAWNFDPGDPTGEATPGSGNSFYSGPEFPNTSSGSLDLASEGQGCNTVNVESWDNMGLQSGDVTDGPLCYDSVKPKITAAPTLRIRNGVSDGGSAVLMAVSWNGSDATSGINHYTLYQSKDGGAYTAVDTTATTQFLKGLAPGHTYQFEVSATDNAGNTSARKAGPAYTLSLYQENSTKITYSTGWTRQALTGSNGGDVKFASAAGKTATLAFTGTGQVGWISTLGPTRGSATVKLGSGSPTTINTNATTAKPAQMVSVLSPSGSGKHSLVISVVGTKGHPRVDVDAFVVLTTSS